MSLVSNPKAKDAYQLSRERGISVAEAQAVFASEGWRPDGYNEVGQAVYLPPVNIINTTPHSIHFAAGDDVIVVESGEIINAHPVEETAYTKDGIEFVHTKFVGDDAGRAAIARIKAESPDSVIVGSIIAAQAYPGDIVAMVPAPGYERVPAPLPKDVVAALEEAAAMSSVRCQAHDVLERYSNLPTKRMRIDKFTVFATDTAESDARELANWLAARLGEMGYSGNAVEGEFALLKSKFGKYLDEE